MTRVRAGDLEAIAMAAAGDAIGPELTENDVQRATLAAFAAVLEADRSVSTSHHATLKTAADVTKFIRRPIAQAIARVIKREDVPIGYVDLSGYLLCRACLVEGKGGLDRPIFADTAPHNAEDCDRCDRPIFRAYALKFVPKDLEIEIRKVIL
jgi:hypothetical protein